MIENNKNLETLVDKLMANDTLEKPSANFTDNILSQLEVKTQSQKFVYKPLISKHVWSVIVVVVFSAIGYVYLKEPVMNSEILDKVNLSNLFKNPFANITIEFSKTLIYAVIFMALMLCIQIPILKNYFNKRFQY